MSFGSPSSSATVAVGESKVVSFEGTYLRTSGILGQITAGNQPQEGVTVSLQGRGENRSMTTNSAGQYAFDELRSGDYAIGISGYDTDEMSFDVTSRTVTVAHGETANIPFEGTLLRTAGIMGTVSVEGVGPIADVTVTIQGNGETHEDETNNAGMYSFERLHAGDYSVTISGFDDDEYGFDVTTATVTVALQDTETVEFDGIMLRTAGISGEVTVGDDDAPLSGVTVTVSGGPRDEEHSRTTDSDGAYLVENLHAGDYSVVISGYDTREYGFEPTTETVSVGLRETLEVAFQGELLRTAGVSGRVSVNEMGIPGVTVTLTGEEDRDPENTNADGQFGFTGLAAGDYTLTISGYDAVEYHFEPTREFELELDESAIKNFTGRALRTAGVMGYVTVEGAPLPGIDVTLIKGVGTSGEIVGAMATGDNGGYTFGPLLAGAYQVSIAGYADEHDFAAGDMQGTAVMTDSTATVNFAATIIRTAMVSGRVTIAGDPMKDVTVTLTGDHAPDDNSRMTGDYGMYEFDDLRKGDYTLTISGYDAVDYEFEPTRESFALELGGEETKNFTGKALRTATVMGYVTVEDAPLPGIGVTLIKVVSATSGEIVGAMPTGADGGYTFGPLLAGAYQVRIAGYADEHDFAAGDMQVTAVMTDSTATVNFAATIIRTASVSGMVTIDGEAMKDVTVTISGEHAPADSSMMTGDDGSYSFGGLRKGDYTVTMTNPDDNAYSFPTVATPVNLGVGQEQPGISFAGTRLKRASISGQVHAAGDPVANVTVTLSGDATGEDMTDDNGEYNFPGLAIGSYTVTISGWAEAAYIFDAPASEADIVNNDDFLIVDFAGEHTMTASISGMLFIDEGGQTALARDAGEPALDLTGVLPEGMTGLPLTLLGPELTSVPTTILANADGTYEFSGLQAGPYVINVDVDQVIEIDPMTNDSATVEDLLAGLGYEYTGPSLMPVDLDAAEEDLDNNLPFKIITQTIFAGAAMGYDTDTVTGDPVGGVGLELYPTAEDLAGGTNMLGKATTDSTGAAKFDFPRAMDLGPGGHGTDHLVFVKVTDTGHKDLVVSDNARIEIQYAATDRVSNATTAVRLLNQAANFQWQIKSNADAKDGNEFLAGWKVVMGTDTIVTGADGKGSYSGTAVLGAEPAKYTVMADTTIQADSLTMKEEWTQSDALVYTHNPLALPAMNTAKLNDLGPIYVTFTTQTLTVGVYREADDVEGYTDYRSGLTGPKTGDHRPAAGVAKDMSIELLARDSRNRLRRYEWDPDEDGEYQKEGMAAVGSNGMVSFTGIPADAELTVRFHVGSSNRIQMDYGFDEIETFDEDLEFGSNVGAFGELSGAGPEVRMCSSSEGTDDEDCATFGYQWKTGKISGNVGKQRGHEVDLEPETGHGATGDDTKTGTGGGYSFSDLQDGEYSVTASSNGNYSVNGPATQKGIAVYHDEYTDDKDSLTKYVGTADDDEDASWETTRGGLAIMGYVANDGDGNNLIRGNEALAGVMVRLLTNAKFTTSGVNAGKLSSSKEAATVPTLANGLYSFTGLNDTTDYWVHVPANGYRSLSAANPSLSGKLSAAVYPAFPEESTYRKPSWNRGTGRASWTTVTYTVGTGAAAQSATLHNFALVYTDGTVAGTVNNVSGSPANIDVRVTTNTDTDIVYERATSRSGDFEVAGIMEGVYTAIIEDAGWEVPCMAGSKPDDDGPTTNVDGVEVCTLRAATSLSGTVSGQDDYESLGVLHVYDGSKSAVDTLGPVTIEARMQGDGAANYNDTTRWESGWTRQDETEETTNDQSVGTISYRSASVTFDFGLLNASIPEGTSVSLKVGTKACAGARCTLVAHKTGVADPPADGMANTITVTVRAENGYDDHEYSVVVARANPVGNVLTADSIVRADTTGASHAAEGTGGTTIGGAFVFTTTGASSVNARIGLSTLGENDDAVCAQAVTVRLFNADKDLEAATNATSDVCSNTRYKLTASTAGMLYQVTVAAEDGVKQTYYLSVVKGATS